MNDTQGFVFMEDLPVHCESIHSDAQCVLSRDCLD